MDLPAFEYCVWFRDGRLPAEDQDHEWPAVFVVRAASAARAQAWGDHLAHGYCQRTPDAEFIRSGVMEPSGTSASLPVVRDGEAATDEAIGW